MMSNSINTDKVVEEDNTGTDKPLSFDLSAVKPDPLAFEEDSSGEEVHDWNEIIKLNELHDKFRLLEVSSRNHPKEIINFGDGRDADTDSALVANGTSAADMPQPSTASSNTNLILELPKTPAKEGARKGKRKPREKKNQQRQHKLDGMHSQVKPQVIEQRPFDLFSTNKPFRVRVISSTDGTEVAIMSNKVVNKIDAAVRTCGPILKQVFIECGKPLAGLYMEKACRDDASMCYNIIRTWFRDGIIDEELWLSIIRDPRPDVCGMSRFAIICYLAILTHFALKVTKRDMVIGEVSQKPCLVQRPIPNLHLHHPQNPHQQLPPQNLDHITREVIYPGPSSSSLVQQHLPSDTYQQQLQQDDNSQSAYYSVLVHQASDGSTGAMNEATSGANEIDKVHNNDLNGGHNSTHHQPLTMLLPPSDDYDLFSQFGIGQSEQLFYSAAAASTNSTLSYHHHQQQQQQQQQQQDMLSSDFNNTALLVTEQLHKNAIPEPSSSEFSRCNSVIQVRTPDELVINVEDEVTYEHLFCIISKLIAYELDTTASLRITSTSAWIHEPAEGEEMLGRTILRAPQGAVFPTFDLATYTLHSRQRFIAPTSKLSRQMTILDCLPVGFIGHVIESIEIKQEVQELLSEAAEAATNRKESGVEPPEQSRRLLSNKKSDVTERKKRLSKSNNSTNISTAAAEAVAMEEKNQLGTASNESSQAKRKRKRSTSAAAHSADTEVPPKPKRRKMADIQHNPNISTTSSTTSTSVTVPASFVGSQSVNLSSNSKSGADLSPTEFYLRSSGVIVDESDGMDVLLPTGVHVDTLDGQNLTRDDEHPSNNSPSALNIPIPRYSPLEHSKPSSPQATPGSRGRQAICPALDLDSILNVDSVVNDGDDKISSNNNNDDGVRAETAKSSRRHQRNRHRRHRSNPVVDNGEGDEEDDEDADDGDSNDEEGVGPRNTLESSKSKQKKQCPHCGKYYQHAPRHGICSGCERTCGSMKNNARARDSRKTDPPNVLLNDTRGELFKSFLAHLLGVRQDTEDFESAFQFISNTGRIKNIAIESCFGCRDGPKYCCRCILEEKIDRRRMFIGLMRADNVGKKKVRIAYICSARCLESIKSTDHGVQRVYYRNDAVRLGNSADSRDVFYLDVQTLPKVLINFNSTNEQYLRNLALNSGNSNGLYRGEWPL